MTTAKMLLPALLLPLLVTDLWAAPHTRYDQRQEGELNVHAHLENFVILLIPSGGSGLFNFAAKVSPAKRHHGKHGNKGTSLEGSVTKQSADSAAAAAPAVKSPPYKVDIDADRRLPIVLEISAPRIRAEDSVDEVVIAESPIVSLTRAPAKDEEEPMKIEPVEEEKPVRAEKPIEEETPVKEEKPIKEEKPMKEEKPQEPAKEETAPEPAKEEAPKKEEKKEEEKKEEEKESNDVPQTAAQAESEPEKQPAEKPTEAAKPAKEEAAAKGDGAERRPALPAAPVPAKPAPAPAAAAPAAVPQEAKARAARLEMLAHGLEPFPAPLCGPNEHRAADGRCVPVYAPARISKSIVDADLLQKLRYGLAPASN